MAATILGALTDAIPLLDDNGSGQFVKGRNSARDIRVELLGGLITKSTTDFVTRKGILAHGTYDTSAGQFTALKATAAGTPNQTLTFAAGRLVSERTGQGPYLSSNESAQTFTMPSADASNPRIDVVYVLPYDQGVPALADAQHGPKFVCETGTPAASPSAPSIPTDAVAICQVARRTIGATPSGNVIQTADITDLRKSSSWHGIPRALLPGDLLADAGGCHGEIRMLTGSFVDAPTQAAGFPIAYEYWDAVSAAWKRLSAGKTPAAQMRQIVAQTIPNTIYASITFTTEDFDTHGGHDTSSNTSRYVCQLAGRYSLNGAIAYAASGSGFRAAVWVKNGTRLPGSQSDALSVSGGPTTQVTARPYQVVLAVNDYIELQAYQNSGGNLDTLVSSADEQSSMLIQYMGV